MPKLSNEEQYEKAEKELIGEAIAETEREVFDDALGEPPDENNGDMSLEEMDDDDLLDDDLDDEDDQTDEAAEGDDGQGEEPDASPPEGRDRSQDRREMRIPAGRLKEESDARRTAEAERDAERARVRELDARLRLIEQGGPREQQKPAEKPDMFADPDGWAKSQREEIERGFEERRINGSFAEAQEANGEKFATAFRSLQASDPATVQTIVKSHNPGRELMKWHDRQQLLTEIGSDPSTYRDKLRQELLSDPEVRRQVISGARRDAIAGDQGGPRTRTRLPPSLSSASGGGSHRGRDPGRSTRSTEQEIFDSAFED